MKNKRDAYKSLAGTITAIIVFISLLGGCSPVPVQSSGSSQNTISNQPVPKLDHVVVITFENKDYDKVMGNPYMPVFNNYAKTYTLLTQYYAVTHPSLPNYLAMIGGDTFGVTGNCSDCFVDAPSLPDAIEASGRTWKTYQEDMEEPCGLGSQDESEYVQKHNPFVYFDSIRMDQARCEQNVVSFEELQLDIEANALPNYIFITPNMCHNSHDCKLNVADAWLGDVMNQLIPALDKAGGKYLIVINWDEGSGNESCCGMAAEAGGRIPVVLVSPLVKKHFTDATPYSHYSLLKTVSNAWDLPYLGHAADEATPLILAPWK